MSQPDLSAEFPPPEDPTTPGPSAAPEAARDLTGTTLGDYRIERRLGQGGMGDVYLATQISLNRPVALKVLRPYLLANPRYLSRFEAEAWAAAKLNHPNIVHIYCLGNIDGLRFIAMEYVQGTNLREYIERKGPPEMALAMQIMRQAGQAVGAAGEVGLIHRDIKPENLLLTRKGHIKVADFGLCRDKEGDLHLTQPGVTMGTPMYMSPEQVQGHALDHRSDLYSLGVTFYHMLAGQPPFRAETALALALKHVRDRPVSLEVHRPDLPPDLNKLVMKLMAKAAGDRYASAEEMLRDLARIKASMPTTVATTASGSGSTTVATTALDVNGSGPAGRPSGPAPAAASWPRWRPTGVRIGRRSIAVVIGLSLVAGAVGGWLARADDLLGEEAPQPGGQPGLWMAAWDKVPRQSGAAAQYHHAQWSASAADQEAAWLAVPGAFPGDARWAVQAYTQLVRALFRLRDRDRLEVLAAELRRSGRHEEKKLATAAGAAAAALRGDVDGVLDALDTGSRALATDAGLAGLCLEVALYTRSTPAGGARAPALTKLIRAYMQALKIDFEPFELAKPG